MQIPTNQRNAYAVLGLHKGASDEQIKMAYVTLVKKYDPEVHTERFMIVQNAFNRLKDPERRAKEDTTTFNFIGGQYNFAPEEKVEVPEDKLQEAIDVLEQRQRAEPANAELASKLIQTLLIRSWRKVQQKLHQEANNDWLRILEIDPTHQRAKHNLIVAFCNMGYAYANHTLYDEAIQVWEKAAQMNPDNHHIIHNLALSYELSGDLDKASRYWIETLRRWKSALERNPADDYLKLCLIEAHRHHAELGQAGNGQAPAAGATAPVSPQPQASAPAQAPRPAAPQSIPQAAPPPRPPQQAPAAAQQPGRPAVDQLEQHMEILRLKPEDFDANYKVGQLLLEQKRWKEAVNHLSELSRKFPRNIDVLIGLGWAQLQGGDVNVAFQTWNRGLKLDPKNFHIREALIKAHMSMGRALREKNLFVNSLNHFKNLAKFLPDSDEVHYEIGLTYKLKGDLSPAYTEFQTVLKLNPKHKPARTALSELKMKRA